MDQESERDNIQIKDGYDLGTFQFLKAGWWIAHVIFIAVVFYIGWIIGANAF